MLKSCSPSSAHSPPPTGAPHDLVAFHSRYKQQLLAHDPSTYQSLGRVVAQASPRPRGILESDYRHGFNKAFAARPKRGRHVNALQHILGIPRERLNDTRRHDVLDAIETYRQGRAPPSIPITLLRHHAEGEDLDYLTRQTYLSPFPGALVLRHHL
ncbi:YbgA family protein [Actinomadura sp. KC06]|uniref:YbgA family protein n=1 Tax=Actinomadura sp. KC06 TaxID=2530369 RepID=UPI00267C1365